MANKYLRKNGTRICSICIREQSLDNYYPKKEGGEQAYCKSCNTIKCRNRYRRKHGLKLDVEDYRYSPDRSVNYG